MKRLYRIADNRRPDALANRFRRRRHRIFEQLADRLQSPVRILDVGGEESYWRQMGALDHESLEIVLLNLDQERASAANVRSVAGDARDLSQFADDEFDVVFSNSVIEHLGVLSDQEAMAAEVRRVGVRYFVQTPNRHFPIEPHFFFPGFQFLPRAIQVGLVRRFALGYHTALPDAAEATAAVEEIRLLNAKELRRLFPEGQIHRERVVGMTKSFVVHGGWGGN